VQENRFLDIAGVRERIPLSKTEIYRRIRAGTFPRPVRLGPMRVAFVESEVMAWMEQCLNNRNAGRAERSEQAVRAAKGLKRAATAKRG
jgi:prophage regulatory protein